MKVIEFTQADGFKDIDIEPEWEDDQTLDEWLSLAGFKRELGECGQELGYQFEIYNRAPDAKHQWHAFVSVGDIMGFDLVVVRSPAELLALRLRLASWITQNLECDVRELLGIARRAFRAWHGHDSDSFCIRCDPHEEEQYMQRLRDAAKKKEGKPGSGVG